MGVCRSEGNFGGLVLAFHLAAVGCLISVVLRTAGPQAPE